jgi:hypothetical protein
MSRVKNFILESFNDKKLLLGGLSLIILGLSIAWNPLISGMIFIGLTAFIVLFLNPEIGLFLLVTFIPLHVILTKKMGILPGIWKEVFMAALLVIFLIKGLMRKRFFLAKTKSSVSILFFVLYSSGLLLNNIGEFNSNIFGLRNLVEYIILYFLVINIVRNTGNIKMYIYSILLTGLLIALFNSVVYLAAPGKIDEILNQSYSSSMRFLAYDFLGANNYPFYLDALACIAFGMAIFIGSKKKELVLALIFCALVAASLLTYSRGPVLALMVAILFCGIRYKKKVLLALILVLFAGLFLLPSTMRERLMTIGSYTEAASVRTDVLLDNLPFALKNLFFGFGLGRVGTAGGPEALYPHNYYMYLLLQTGVIGLLIYLWVWAVFFKTALSLVGKFQDRFFKGLLAGISIYYLMFAVSGFVMASGEAFLTAFIFWFFGGVVMVLDKHSRATEGITYD